MGIKADKKLRFKDINKAKEALNNVKDNLIETEVERD